ncbi:UNVERIFIED_CONTAM: Transposon Ty3-G Gag-Pol polyprotein [Sesamum indicum]
MDLSFNNKRKGREEEKELKKKEEHKHGLKPQPRDSTSKQAGNGDNLPTAGVIAVISGGPAGGDSANARRALTQAARGSHAQTPIQVHTIRSQQEDEISFSQQDLELTRNQNNDALLGVDNAQLRKVNTPLTGFSGDMIQPMGGGDAAVIPRFSSKKIHEISEVPRGESPIRLQRHLGSREKTDEATNEKMKRKITDGRRETTDPPEGYVGAPCGEKRVEAVEELKVIHLSTDGEKTVKIGTKMCQSTEESLTRFLVENDRVFAWSMMDFYGIPPDVITHQLNVNLEAKPVKQKKRIFGLMRNQAIQMEMDKLLEAKHIRPVQYPEWLANVVLVPKPNEKWRLCIDFTNLNKACPKDPFPLPRIVLLVDSTSGCEMLSFLDAYQGYNKISLALEDQEKTSFVTDQEIFCYNVMPFDLKNARATYQRLINDMFKNEIGRNMEVYIDDMLVKSVKEQDHIKDLEECF